VEKRLKNRVGGGLGGGRLGGCGGGVGGGGGGGAQTWIMSFRHDLAAPTDYSKVQYNILRERGGKKSSLEPACTRRSYAYKKRALKPGWYRGGKKYDAGKDMVNKMRWVDDGQTYCGRRRSIMQTQEGVTMGNSHRITLTIATKSPERGNGSNRFGTTSWKEKKNN